MTLNGANEVAVQLVLEKKLPFFRIASVLEAALDRLPAQPVTDVRQVYAADREARRVAQEVAGQWKL